TTNPRLDVERRAGTPRGPFSHPCVMHFYSGLPTHFLSGVDTFGRITEDRIRRGVFKSVTELKAAIQDYLHQHNANPKPFTWTASATAILEKVARGRQALESAH